MPLIVLLFLFATALLFLGFLAFNDRFWGPFFCFGLFGLFLLLGASTVARDYYVQNWNMLLACPNQEQIQKERAGTCKPNITVHFKDGWVDYVKYNYPPKKHR